MIWWFVKIWVGVIFVGLVRTYDEIRQARKYREKLERKYYEQ